MRQIRVTNGVSRDSARLTRIVAPNWLKVLAWVYLGWVIGAACVLILKADQISAWFDRYLLKKDKE